MAMSEDDRIELEATLRDHVSGPAYKAKKSIDELGDEAAEAAAQVEALAAAQRTLKDDTVELTDATNELEDATKSAHWSQKQMRDENGRFIKSVDRHTRSIDRNTRAIKRNVSSMRGMMRFGRMINFLAGGAKIGAITTAIPFLAKAIQGLGAAGYAGAAGLAPLIGNLVALPNLLAASIQGVVGLKLATSGMGEALKVLMDPKATKQQRAAASKGLSTGGMEFVQWVADRNRELSSFKKELQDILFLGISDPLMELTKVYTPILRDNMRETVNSTRDVLNYTMRWVKADSKRVDTLMSTNAKLVKIWGTGGSSWLRGLIGLMNTAGPMTKRMGRGFDNQGREFDRWVRENQDSLTEFFNGSYKLLRKSSKVIGNYSVGLYNIGLASDVLGDHMGRGIMKNSKSFKQWTGSKEGQERLRRFFNDAIPVVDEMMKWFPALWEAVGIVSLGNGDFISTSKWLRTVALPEIAHTLRNVAEWFIDVAGELNESGLTSGLWTGLKWMGKGVRSITDLLTDMPEDFTKLLGFASALWATYRITKRMTGFGGKRGGGLLGKAWDHFKGRGSASNPMFVVVLNNGVGVGGDIPGGGGKKQPWWKRAGNTAKKGLPFLGAVGGPVGALAGTTWALNETGITGWFEKNLPYFMPSADGKGWADKTKQGANWLWDNTFGEPDKKRKKDDGTLRNLLLPGSLYNGTNALPKDVDPTVAALLGLGGKKRRKTTMDVTLRPNAKPVEKRIRDLNRSRASVTLEPTIDQNALNAVQTTMRGLRMASMLTGGLLPMFYAGGQHDGGKALVGELGPEAFVSRTGKVSMVGLNGPEVRNLGPGAVVPASATRNPFGGDVGNAPASAVRALQDAVLAGQGGGDTFKAEVTVYPQTEMDVEGAVTRAMRKVQRERAERR